MYKDDNLDPFGMIYDSVGGAMFNSYFADIHHVTYLVGEQQAVVNKNAQNGKMTENHLTYRIGIMAKKIIEALKPKNIKEK